MPGRPSAIKINLNEQTRMVLHGWIQRQKTPFGLVKRAQAILSLSQGHSFIATAKHVGLTERHVHSWARRFVEQGPAGLYNRPRSGRKPLFEPSVALYAVKLACEQPDQHGRSLSQWDCREIARQLVADGIVQAISAETVRRIFHYHHLKPWRHHLWLSPRVARDAAFASVVQEISTLYTRPLAAWEVVVSIDEKTNLQPRPRKAPTLPAQADKPIRLEHEYQRKGAVNLFAAFDTRSGHVSAAVASRKRQVEFIAFLKQLDREVVGKVTTIHVVLDNVSAHKGKQVQAWLVEHPRFVLHFLPTHCSWMNQVEQFFSLLQRKRLRFSDFTDTATLKERLLAFVQEWNRDAHPFNWSTQSVSKVMAKCHSPSSLVA